MGNGYIKTFLRNCQKPVTASSTPNEIEPATGFAQCYFLHLGCYGTHQETFKMLKSLFRLWGIFLPYLTILSRKDNEPTLFITSI